MCATVRVLAVVWVCFRVQTNATQPRQFIQINIFPSENSANTSISLEIKTQIIITITQIRLGHENSTPHTDLMGIL